MATRKLEPSEWKSYMDRVSRHLPSTRAEIHVMGLDLGDQVEADSIPLVGITYDAADGELLITSDSIEHAIADPKEIYVEEEEGSLKAIQVVDADGHEQVIALHRALNLPPG